MAPGFIERKIIIAEYLVYLESFRTAKALCGGQWTFAHTAKPWEGDVVEKNRPKCIRHE